MKGSELRAALSQLIISKHRPRSYGELYDIFLESDLDQTYENDGSIQDMYSERAESIDPYVYRGQEQRCGDYTRESACFNREHLFPQSIFEHKEPMRSDFHHIYPTDGFVNGKRRSLPFGEVAKARWVSKNGSKIGANTYGHYRGSVFEPINEFKGDIARALLYFGLRYQKEALNWKHPMIDSKNKKFYSGWFISLLLKWNRQDPVSKHENFRNNIGEKFQGNRNPFIDNPEWANLIWNNL